MNHEQNGNNNTAADANVEQDLSDAPNGEKEAKRFTTPCRIHFHHVRKRLADLDGLSVKAVIDGFVHAGLFADDSPEQIAEVTHSQSKGRDEKTIVTIEEIE